MSKQVEVTEEAVQAALIRTGTHVVRAVWIAGVVLVAVVAWVVRTDTAIAAIGADVTEIKRVTVAELEKRVRTLETDVAVGILPEAKGKMAELEVRLRKLESRRPGRTARPATAKP